MIGTPDFQHTIGRILVLILLLWIIWFVDSWFNLGLYRFGVYPGRPSGLLGILFGPLIHGSWEHLFANSLPLLILGFTVLYAYPRSAPIALPAIYLGSGLGLWLFARSSHHIGASGLIHGMMFFVFVIGILRRDRFSIALALIVFFLYGGMIWSIFPQAPEISYEAHFLGAAIGVLMAFLLRNLDPPPPKKKYKWEGEPEDAEDPVIGDQWRKP